METKPKKKMDLFLAFLTSFLVVGFMGIIAALCVWPVPDGNRETLVYMAGQLSGFTAASVGFWYHTTFQSGQKTDLLAKAEPVKE